MHGKYFETDESIARSYNTIHRPAWWVDKSDELIFLFLVFFLGKVAFYLLVFCSLQRDSAQIIWSNYFLNNFSLLNGLLRLVCLLMVYRYFIMIIDQQDVGKFSDDTFFNNSLLYCITWSINEYLPLSIFSFLFLQTFLLINSIPLCFDLWIFCHILANLFPRFWLFLKHFWVLWNTDVHE